MISGTGASSASAATSQAPLAVVRQLADIGGASLIGMLVAAVNATLAGLAVPELQIMNEKLQIHETAAQQLGRDRAIEPAAVEIAQSEMIGEAAREGALAGRRRTVYGDDRDVRQYSRRDR